MKNLLKPKIKKFKLLNKESNSDLLNALSILKLQLLLNSLKIKNRNISNQNYKLKLIKFNLEGVTNI